MQPLKPLRYMTLLGMVTEVKPVQSLKALLPMEVTLFGMVIAVRPVQPMKASEGIRVTLSPIFKFDKLVQP